MTSPIRDEPMYDRDLDYIEVMQNGFHHPIPASPHVLKVRLAILLGYFIMLGVACGLALRYPILTLVPTLVSMAMFPLINKLLL